MTDVPSERLLVDLTERLRDRYFGKYRGIVEAVDDGEGLGRIVAKVPSVYGERNSPWALPAVPFAGPSYGLAMLPKRGDGVWIEFEAGNISKPIWAGFWWASGEMPEDAGPEVRSLISPAGLKIILDDKNTELKLVHPAGAEITLSDKGIELKFKTSKINLKSTGVSINDTAFEVK